jgi:ornithine decarboxylase
MTPKIERFLTEQDHQTPFLVVDLDVVAENYKKLRHGLPLAEIYYAVKANPARPVLETLVELGSSFDAASLAEIEQCLAVGARPQTISFGNTVKKERDIAAAFRHGVDLYAFDSAEELEKLARSAPGSKVYCRIMIPNEGADWPLSKKFGCEAGMARDLLVAAHDAGLVPHGISFHVGSQQTDPRAWEVAIAKTAMIFTDLRANGIELKMVNLGGGFPARYRSEVPDFDRYAETIMKAVTRHFGNDLPGLIIEPGRSVVAEAGVLQSEVVLVSSRSRDDELRWVYLDVGIFGGLAEALGEAIKYPIRTPHDGKADGPVVIAGPTCDGVDILYEKAGYRMPCALRSGDKVRILAAGAYTTTYASVGFNGFEPLKEYFV